MDEVIVPLRMSGGDYVLIYQIARSEGRSVNEWILSCILERMQRMREEWIKNKAGREEVRGGEGVERGG
ncbi:MAG: hypothetical protein QXU69_10305 [Thermofilaceae archaeon]